MSQNSRLGADGHNREVGDGPVWLLNVEQLHCCTKCSIFTWMCHCEVWLNYMFILGAGFADLAKWKKNSSNSAQTKLRDNEDGKITKYKDTDWNNSTAQNMSPSLQLQLLRWMFFVLWLQRQIKTKNLEASTPRNQTENHQFNQRRRL